MICIITLHKARPSHPGHAQRPTTDLPKPVVSRAEEGSQQKQLHIIRQVPSVAETAAAFTILRRRKKILHEEQVGPPPLFAPSCSSSISTMPSTTTWLQYVPQDSSTRVRQDVQRYRDAKELGR